MNGAAQERNLVSNGMLKPRQEIRFSKRSCVDSPDGPAPRILAHNSGSSRGAESPLRSGVAQQRKAHRIARDLKRAEDVLRWGRVRQDPYYGGPDRCFGGPDRVTIARRW